MADIDLSLGRWFAARAGSSPSRRALTFEGATLTYGQLQDRIDRLAGALREGGVCHGDRVGFLGLNQPAFIETLFAASRLGAIFVPLNFRLTGPELTFIVGDAGIHTLVVDPTFTGVIDQIRADLPCRRYLAVDAAAPAGPDRSGQADSDGPAGAAAAGWQRYDDAFSHAPLAQPESVALDEVAVIMYTSGTTGRPKGAMLTHGNLWWNNTSMMHMFDILGGDVTLVVAPLFHIGGLNVTTLLTWQRGGEVVLHRSFDPGAALAAIEEYRVTTMFGVPAMYLFMSQHPSFASTDLSSVRLFICGGAPVPEPLIKLYNGRGIPIQQGYGLTETSPSVAFLEAEYALAKVGSTGKPPMFVDVKLDGADRPDAEGRGEICVRGRNVMKGYWNRPDATAAAIDPEGWFHTGDLGHIDDEGFLYVVDRVKDMVITGGENVYPAEVESVLYQHPAVAEVAVVGVPDERWGEVVVAVVAAMPGQEVTLEGLREWAAGQLARFKLPSRLELVDALPRNPAGKVLKYELRRRFGAGPEVPVTPVR